MPRAIPEFPCGCGCGPVKSVGRELRHLQGQGPAYIHIDHIMKELGRPSRQSRPTGCGRVIVKKHKLRIPDSPIADPPSPIPLERCGDPGPSTSRHWDSIRRSSSPLPNSQPSPTRIFSPQPTPQARCPPPWEGPSLRETSPFGTQPLHRVTVEDADDDEDSVRDGVEDEEGWQSDSDDDEGWLEGHGVSATDALREEFEMEASKLGMSKNTQFLR